MYDEGDRRPDAAFWQTFLTRERLPELYRETAETWFSPLVEATWQRHCEEKTLPTSPPQIIGIHGCQGSGKSTLAALVEAWLTTVFGLSVLRFSIDDFYLTKHDRQSLAKNIHPLFATRGVPGTHDIALLETVMQAVITRSDGEIVIPEFDKATDDRASHGKTVAPHNIDVVILEGWCVGLPPEPEQRLDQPANGLEREQDPAAIWRRDVNQALAGRYSTVFDLITTLVVLKAPHFDTVVDWRWEQEQKLIKRHRLSSPVNGALMDRRGVERFVEFYQRLTEWGLQVMPGRADFCFYLDQSRQITSYSGPSADAQTTDTTP